MNTFLVSCSQMLTVFKVSFGKQELYLKIIFFDKKKFCFKTKWTVIVILLLETERGSALTDTLHH